MANDVSAISGTPKTTQTVQQTAKTDNSTLSKNDFLKLFVEGLKNQDPMSPMDNSEMMNQMTMLGLMENSTNMATATEKLSDTMSTMSLVSASGMIGKTVDVMGENGVVTGEVGSVRPYEGALYLMINGTPYDVKNLISVGESIKEDETTTV